MYSEERPENCTWHRSADQIFVPTGQWHTEEKYWCLIELSVFIVTTNWGVTIRSLGRLMSSAVEVCSKGLDRVPFDCSIYILSDHFFFKDL